MFEVPQVYTECIPNAPAFEFSTTALRFGDFILTFLKFFIFMESAVSLALQQEWVLSGFSTASSLMALIASIVGVMSTL